jgi:septum formation topological specificity factor MinE
MPHYDAKVFYVMQAQVAKNSYHHPSKYLNQNVFPQLQYLLFRIMCLFSKKWVSKQVLNDHTGTYVSLKSEIIRYIKNHVNPETDKIKIKISEDGSKVSRISNFVVLSFSVITDDLT